MTKYASMPVCQYARMRVYTCLYKKLNKKKVGLKKNKRKETNGNNSEAKEYVRKKEASEETRNLAQHPQKCTTPKKKPYWEVLVYTL